MNAQTHLSELDATKLANLNLRQQLLNAEREALERELGTTYGNPNEHITIGPDGSITRTTTTDPKPKKRTRTP